MPLNRDDKGTELLNEGIDNELYVIEQFEKIAIDYDVKVIYDFGSFNHYDLELKLGDESLRIELENTKSLSFDNYEKTKKSWYRGISIPYRKYKNAKNNEFDFWIKTGKTNDTCVCVSNLIITNGVFDIKNYNKPNKTTHSTSDHTFALISWETFEKQYHLGYIGNLKPCIRRLCDYLTNKFALSIK